MFKTRRFLLLRRALDCLNLFKCSFTLTNIADAVAVSPLTTVIEQLFPTEKDSPVAVIVELTLARVVNPTTCRQHYSVYSF